MTPPDSITVNLPSSFNSIDSLVRQPAKPQTPYQVLRLLPKDATPAQQDSAIQAWFGHAEIHYSEQPDTLHLPGHEVPRDLKKVNIPQYYRENYFSNDTLYHEEVSAARFGVAGDPVPYALHNDDIITGLLLLCFLFIMLIMSRISGFMLHQAKDFFYPSKAKNLLLETGLEIRMQIVFTVVTCLLLALSYFFYVIRYNSDSFILDSEYALLGIYMATFIAYFCVKMLLYTVVNTTFFDHKKNLQFLGSLLFITSIEGMLLFPQVLLLIYFQISVQNAAYYFIFVLSFVKILTFYKSYIIFFKQKDFFLQIILYFCTLEMIPLSVLWTALMVITNSLKVNF
jgi:hypothetical protein